MNLSTLALSRTTLFATTFLTLAASATNAADDRDAPKGPAISTLKAAKACFSNIVEVSGTILARDEAQSQVRPDRIGLKVAEVLADAGDVVTAGQALARLTLPEGGTQNITARPPPSQTSSSARLSSASPPTAGCRSTPRAAR